jgi:hypothetical protein
MKETKKRNIPKIYKTRKSSKAYARRTLKTYADYVKAADEETKELAKNAKGNKGMTAAMKEHRIGCNFKYGNSY